MKRDHTKTTTPQNQSKNTTPTPEKKARGQPMRQKQPFMDLGVDSWIRTFRYQPDEQQQSSHPPPSRKTEVDQLWALKPEERALVRIVDLVPVPRWQQVYGTHDYTFTGVTHKAVPTPPLIQSYLDYANRVCAEWLPPGRLFNMAFVNWYKNGSDYIGFHSDDEKQLYQNERGETLVFSLSFGATRDFVLKPRDPDSSEAVGFKIELAHHDALLMGGRCQKTHKHALPKITGRRAECIEQRVNITFRIFK